MGVARMTDNLSEAYVRKLENRNSDKKEAIESAVKHLQPFVQNGFVHESELEGLIEEWRENPGEVYFNENENLAVEQCIEDLEALLERK